MKGNAILIAIPIWDKIVLWYSTWSLTCLGSREDGAEPPSDGGVRRPHDAERQRQHGNAHAGKRHLHLSHSLVTGHSFVTLLVTCGHSIWRFTNSVTTTQHLSRARPTAISSTRCSLFLSLFRILYPTRRIGSLLGEAWKMYGPVREGFKLGLCVAIS